MEIEFVYVEGDALSETMKERVRQAVAQTGTQLDRQTPIQEVPEQDRRREVAPPAVFLHTEGLSYVLSADSEAPADQDRAPSVDEIVRWLLQRQQEAARRRRH